MTVKGRDRKRINTLIVLCLFAALPLPCAAGDRTAGDNLLNNKTEWVEHSFQGHTVYQLREAEHPPVLEAKCENTASALYRESAVDLTKTPVLHWSWRVAGTHPQLNDQTKEGDDYAARVYVVYAPNALMPWRTKAIDYVWSNSQPKGSVWPNAFTDQAVMVATETGNPPSSQQWVAESRNVREDFKTSFGLDITHIDGVAVMTDCDNAGLPMTGYYRDIRFAAE